LVAEGPLPQRLPQARLDFFAIERLAYAVFFHDVQHRLFDPFIRRETARAMDALAAAADGKTILAGAGIDYFVVIDAAVGATHTFIIQGGRGAGRGGRLRLNASTSHLSLSCKRLCDASRILYNASTLTKGKIAR